MPFPTPDFEPITLLILGIGLGLLGVALLLTGGPSRRLCLALGLAAALSAGLAAWAPFPEPLVPLRSPLLALAVVSAACCAVASPHAPRLTTSALAVAGRHRTQGAALLGACPLLLFGGFWLTEREGEEPVPARRLVPFDAAAEPRQQEEHAAWTDQGTRLTVLEVTPHAALPAAAAAEMCLLESQGLDLRLIRTGPPDGRSNCHGWVYTGGRYFVEGREVATILRDNDYHIVSAPQAGDLVIYRDREGNIMHSAVVRGILDGGVVMLESKWGPLGRFLHRPEDYAFCDHWTYYRSPRAGHLLHNLGDAPPAAVAELTQADDGSPPRD
jgi:hypothetical protein